MSSKTRWPKRRPRGATLALLLSALLVAWLAAGCEGLLTPPQTEETVAVEPCAAAPTVVQNLADGLNALDRTAILNTFAPRHRLVLSLAWPMLISRLNQAGITFEVSGVWHECTPQEPNTAMLRIGGTVTVFDRETGEVTTQIEDRSIDIPLECDGGGCYLAISITDLLQQVGLSQE